jgi:hypothetical protein
MIQTFITRRFDRWTLRVISRICGCFLQSLNNLRGRKGEATSEGLTDDDRMQGPIVWLGDVRSNGEARKKDVAG